MFSDRNLSLVSSFDKLPIFSYIFILTQNIIRLEKRLSCPLALSHWKCLLLHVSDLETYPFFFEWIV